MGNCHTTTTSLVPLNGTTDEAAKQSSQYSSTVSKQQQKNVVMGGRGDKSATLVVVGLDNSGKTSIVNNIIGDLESFIMPTWGFDLQQTRRRDYKLKFYGLGGSKSIRGYWQQYYDEVHALLFVVDSADRERMSEMAEVFNEMCQHPSVNGKPILVYANKQDLPGAMTSAEIANVLRLHQLHNSPHHITPSVALYDPSAAVVAQVDQRIFDGLDWVLNGVSEMYDELQQRIQVDVAERKRLDKQSIEEQRARVKQYKVEREQAVTVVDGDGAAVLLRAEEDELPGMPSVAGSTITPARPTVAIVTAAKEEAEKDEARPEEVEQQQQQPSFEEKYETDEQDTEVGDANDVEGVVSVKRNSVRTSPPIDTSLLLTVMDGCWLQLFTINNNNNDTNDQQCVLCVDEQDGYVTFNDAKDFAYSSLSLFRVVHCGETFVSLETATGMCIVEEDDDHYVLAARQSSKPSMFEVHVRDGRYIVLSSRRSGRYVSSSTIIDEYGHVCTTDSIDDATVFDYTVAPFQSSLPDSAGFTSGALVCIEHTSTQHRWTVFEDNAVDIASSSSSSMVRVAQMYTIQQSAANEEGKVFALKSMYGTYLTIDATQSTLCDGAIAPTTLFQIDTTLPPPPPPPSSSSTGQHQQQSFRLRSADGAQTLCVRDTSEHNLQMMDTDSDNSSVFTMKLLKPAPMQRVRSAASMILVEKLRQMSQLVRSPSTEYGLAVHLVEGRNILDTRTQQPPTRPYCTVTSRRQTLFTSSVGRVHAETNEISWDNHNDAHLFLRLDNGVHEQPRELVVNVHTQSGEVMDATIDPVIASCVIGLPSDWFKNTLTIAQYASLKRGDNHKIDNGSILVLIERN